MTTISGGAAVIVIAIAAALSSKRPEEVAATVPIENKPPAVQPSRLGPSAEVPPVPDDTPVVTYPPSARRRKSGEQVGSGPKVTGPGRLKVINGNNEDAVVFLQFADSGKLYRAFYVRGNETGWLDAIANGSYTLSFVLGTEWDEDKTVFRQSAGAQKMDDPFKFSSRSVWTVTLQPVVDGNASSTPISESSLPKL